MQFLPLLEIFFSKKINYVNSWQQSSILAAKGPFVYKVDKWDLDSVTWSHLILEFFETFYKHAPWNKLPESTIFGPTNQKLWKNKKIKRNLAIRWSQYVSTNSNCLNRFLLYHHDPCNSYLGVQVANFECFYNMQEQVRHWKACFYLLYYMFLSCFINMLIKFWSLNAMSHVKYKHRFTSLYCFKT
jgi:hypothetical protein